MRGDAREVGPGSLADLLRQIDVGYAAVTCGLLEPTGDAARHARITCLYAATKLAARAARGRGRHRGSRPPGAGTDSAAVSCYASAGGGQWASSSELIAPHHLPGPLP